MVTLKVKLLRSMAEKSIGLIGANPVYPVYFTTRWGIHTFGVLSPIDVLILDTNDCVVAIRQKMKPNRLFFWNPKYDRVVELPLGVIEKMKIILGDRVAFKFIRTVLPCQHARR
jgi:uncharacterized membrane protein (UPF0127 family)